ncbi:MAG: hypothetical protein ABEJ72_02945 [Candidatus Aenigmatarchaeota archaeon]
MGTEEDGINEESIEQAEEVVEGVIGFMEDEEGVHYQDVTRQVEDELGERVLSQTVTRLLRQGRIDRVEYNGELRLKTGNLDPERFVGTEKMDTGVWGEEVTVFYPTERHENPDTEFDSWTYGWSPYLHYEHSRRHNEEIDDWRFDLDEEEERFVSSYSLKGKNPETLPNERTLRYEVTVDEEASYVTPSLTLRRPRNGDWSIHPRNAKAYMHKVHHGGKNRNGGYYLGKKVLGERTRKGEELAEMAADLISEGEITHEKIERDMEDYRDYFLREDLQDFDYTDPITTNSFLEELDSYVETMKGYYEELPQTKRQTKKETRTSQKNFTGPVLDFMDFVEDSIHRRLN